LAATWPADLLPPNYPLGAGENEILLYDNLRIGECEEGDADVDPRDGSKPDDDMSVVACTCNDVTLCNGGKSLGASTAMTFIFFAVFTKML